MYAAAALVGAALGTVVPTPYDIMLAEDLVYAPADAPAGEWWPRGRSAVLFVAGRDGVVDPEAHWNVFPLGGKTSWAREVAAVRQNVARVKDAPRLCEGDWLPPAAEAYQIFIFNLTHAEHLRVRLLWEPDRADRIAVAIDETRRLADLWLAIHNTRTREPWDKPRRMRLAAVREMIGEEAWANRELPPVAALWSFTPR